VSAQADAASVLRARFRHACPEPFELEPLAADAINSSNWLVRVGGVPRYVFKRGAPQEHLDLYAEFCRRAPLLPRLVAHALQDGALYRLIEYREGHGFPDTEDALGNAARALATVQAALRDMHPVPGAAGYAPLAGAELGAAGALAARLAGWSREVEALEALPGLPRGWIHHDYHPGNVLFSGERVVAILDMDSLITDFRMQAVAFAASRFGGGRRFIDAYHATDPLTPQELAQDRAFVRREAIRRINFILRDASGRWAADLAKHLAVLQ